MYLLPAAGSIVNQDSLPRLLGIQPARSPLGAHKPATLQAPLLHVALGVPVKPTEQVAVHAAPAAAGRGQANAAALAARGGWIEHPGEWTCEQAKRWMIRQLQAK